MVDQVGAFGGDGVGVALAGSKCGFDRFLSQFFGGKIFVGDQFGRPRRCRIGAAATHEPGKKAHTGKLAPGATATATLRIVDALNFPKNQCKPTLAAGLRISVPGGSGNKIAPLAFEACALTKSKTLAVSVITAA